MNYGTCSTPITHVCFIISRLWLLLKSLDGLITLIDSTERAGRQAKSENEKFFSESLTRESVLTENHSSDVTNDQWPSEFPLRSLVMETKSFI